MERHAVNDDRTTLIHAYLDGELTDRQQRDLRGWLNEDCRNVDRFVAECRLHSELCDTHGQVANRGAGCFLPLELGCWSAIGGDSDALPPPSAPRLSPSSVPPIVLDLSPALHSPLFTLHSPVGGFLFSYAVASLLLGVALLAGWSSTISRDRQIANEEKAPLQKLDLPPSFGESPLVGQITAAVDCVWTDPATETFDRDDVPLGREYALKAGLLEITYQSGVRVILQGPVKFTVESAKGGFLSLGKLTALVERKSAVGSRQSAVSPQSESLPTAHYPLPTDRGSRGERTANLTFSSTEKAPTTSLAPCPSSSTSEIRKPKSELSNPQSLIPDPLFSVRTPTAVVTDLGTEFGVEVEVSGLSRTTVFQGKIEMRPADGGGDPRQTLQLTANQSAELRAGPDHVPTIVRQPTWPNAFVRQIPNRTPSVAGRVANQSRSQPTYRLTDLGTLGGPVSYAIGINAAGQVTGFSVTATGTPHAFLYSNGVMTDLHPLPDFASTAFAVNNRGQVVGDYWPNDNGNCHAYLFSAGKMTDLLPLHGGDSFARGLNDRGQVVGYSTDRKTGRSRAFLYSNGKTTDLGADTCASDINAAGQVVGYCETPDKSTKHAFRYCPGAGRKDLGTLGGNISGALRINDLGQVVGCSSAATGAGGGGLPRQRVSLRRRRGNERPRLPGRISQLRLRHQRQGANRGRCDGLPRRYSRLPLSTRWHHD